MPTYFFDTEIAGERAQDDDGVSLPDLAAAREEGLLALFGLAAEAPSDEQGLRAVLHIRDDKGAQLLTLVMNIETSMPPDAPG